MTSTVTKSRLLIPLKFMAMWAKDPSAGINRTCERSLIRFGKWWNVMVLVPGEKIQPIVGRWAHFYILYIIGFLCGGEGKGKEEEPFFSEYYIDRKRIGNKEGRRTSERKEAEEGFWKRGKEIKLLADSGPKWITQIAFSPTSFLFHFSSSILFFRSPPLNTLISISFFKVIP